jgi:hypothetical protein
MEGDPLIANRQAVLGGHIRAELTEDRGQRTSVRPRTVMESHGPNGRESSPSTIPTTKPERRRETRKELERDLIIPDYTEIVGATGVIS